MWVWTLDPTELVPIALVAALYVRRIVSLAGKGQRVAWWRPVCFLSGLLLATVAFASPIDWVGENRSFAIHMVQHLLLGDLAPLLCVAGVSGPILRPLLSLPVIARLRVLAHPFVAFPIWALTLALWHLPGAYQLALNNDTVHALEHASFFIGGSLLWAAILEPLPGPIWFGTGAKLFYVLGVRAFETLLAFVFVWSNTIIYPYYTHVPHPWGWNTLEDQNLGGIAMLGEGSTVTIIAFLWLFWRWLSDDELATELIERGIPKRQVNRAIRYHRARAILDALPAPETRRAESP